MSGTNPVGTWALPFSTGGGVQDPTTYKGNLDADMAVAQRVADAFAPKPASPAAMSVLVDAGFIDSVGPAGLQTVTEVAAQTVTIATAPGSPNNRIDLVVIDAATGVASVIAGTPASSAVAPALTAGKRKIAQVSVPNGTTAIGSSAITDLRASWGAFAPGIAWAVATGSADTITATYTPANAALVDGLILGFRATAANATTTPTFNPDGLGAKTIVKKGGAALAAGDIPAALAECVLRYNLANTRWELVDPFVQLPSIANGHVLANATGSTALAQDTTVTALLDLALGSTNGNYAQRVAGTWTGAAITISSGAVNQAALKSTNGTVSLSDSSEINQATLPGGPYGFYPQIKASNAGGLTAWAGIGGLAADDGSANPVGDSTYNSSTFTALFTLMSNGSAAGHSMTVQQQYIQASPPYNLGDGDVQGFIFALIEKGSGRIFATYAAPEAPWIYNGPTKVVPTRIDEKGRKFRSVARRAISLDEVRTKRASLMEYRASPVSKVEMEITQATYHADMPLIPHPFASFNLDRHIVVLLDPMHDLIGTLLEEQNQGEDINSLIYDGLLRFDNAPLVRKGPPGVMQVAIR